MTDHVVVLEMADTSQEMGFFGNVFIRRIPLVGKQIVPGHRHNYAHASIVVRGRIRLRLHYEDGRACERTYDAPAAFEVPAEAYHEMRAESAEAEVWCTFAVRDADGAIAEFVKEEHLTKRFAV